MNGCEDKIASIELWLDGELSGAESESLRVHMAACAGCSEARRRLEKLQSTLTGVLLSEAQRVDFMPFWRAVQLRVNEKRPWYQDALDWMRGVLPASRVAWVVPAVIVLLLAGVSLESYWRGRRRTQRLRHRRVDRRVWTQRRLVARIRYQDDRHLVVSRSRR